MKPKIIIGALVVLLAGGGGWLLFGRATPTANQNVFAPRQVQSAALVVPGQVQVSSHKRAALSFQTQGTLKAINVHVGQQVQAGQVLAVLHAANYRQAVTQAAAAVAQAQANLSRVEAPPTDQQAAQYAAQLAAAKAALDNAQTGYTDAQAAYQQGMTRAQEQLSLAQQNLTQSQAASSSAQQAAQEAQMQLTLAQQAYPSTAYQVVQAQEGYDQAAAAAAQAQSQAAAAQTALQQAQDVVNNPVQLKSALDQATSGLASAQKAYDQAQAAYNLETGPPVPQDVQVAQAAVQQAQANLSAAQIQLADTQLVAPFSGTVTSVAALVGAFAGPQAPSVEMAAITADNLRVYAQVAQESLGKVQPGAEVSITSHNFPGVVFSGRVLTVAPAATVVQGISTYQVKLSVSGKGDLKPGMSVEVHFAS